MRYRGALYRALNPLYARDPFSGEGAALYGGRFNPKGVRALYAATSSVTALREANQAGSFQPVTLVAYEADIDDVFDSSDEAALGAEGLDAAGLADPGWRGAMRRSGEAPTRTFARRLIAAGWRGLVVRSFAPGTSAADMNLVLWRWAPDASCRLILIDDDNRLGRSAPPEQPA